MSYRFAYAAVLTWLATNGVFSLFYSPEYIVGVEQMRKTTPAWKMSNRHFNHVCNVTKRSKTQTIGNREPCYINDSKLQFLFIQPRDTFKCNKYTSKYTGLNQGCPKCTFVAYNIVTIGKAYTGSWSCRHFSWIPCSMEQCGILAAF